MSHIRFLTAAALSGLLLVGCSSLKNYDIFVKDPNKEELSQQQPQTDETEVSQSETETEAAKSNADYVSITDPSRHPASTIICSSSKEQGRNKRSVIRKECTDMDGVFENAEDFGSDYAEWE